MLTNVRKYLASLVAGKAITEPSEWYQPSLTMWDTLERTTSFNPTGQQAINAYVSVTWICCSRVAQLCASTPIRLYKPKRGGKSSLSRAKKKYLRDPIEGPGYKAAMLAQRAEEFEEIPDHPALELLRDPNQFDIGMNATQLRFANKMLSGNAYLLIERESKRGEPNNLYDLCPAWTTVNTSAETFIDSYRYGRNAAQQRVYDASDVIHFVEERDPVVPYMGTGVVVRMLMEHGLYIAINQKQMNLMLSDSRPDMFGTTDVNITPTQLQQLDAQFDAKFRGINKKNRIMWGTGGIKDVKPLAFPSKDTADIEWQRLIGSNIAAAFGIAESDIYGNSANLATAQVGKVQTARIAVLPRLAKDAETLNERYLPLWPELERQGAWFAYDNPVPEDEAARAQWLVTAPLTLNEARAEMGYEPVEGGDTTRANGAQMVYTKPEPLYPATTETEDAEDEKPDAGTEAEADETSGDGEMDTDGTEGAKSGVNRGADRREVGAAGTASVGCACCGGVKGGTSRTCDDRAGADNHSSRQALDHGACAAKSDDVREVRTGVEVGLGVDNEIHHAVQRATLPLRRSAAALARVADIEWVRTINGTIQTRVRDSGTERTERGNRSADGSSRGADPTGTDNHDAVSRMETNGQDTRGHPVADCASGRGDGVDVATRQQPNLEPANGEGETVNEPPSVRWYRTVRNTMHDQRDSIMAAMDEKPYGLKSMRRKDYADPTIVMGMMKSWGVDVQSWSATMYESSVSFSTDALYTGVLNGLGTVREAGWSQPQPDDFYISSEPVAQAAARRGAEYERAIVDLNTETARMVKETIEEGLRNGDGFYAMKQKIRDVFDSETPEGATSSDYRASRIVRTESAFAQGEGARAGWRSTRVVRGKSFVKSPISCPICEAVGAEYAGKVIGIDEAFYPLGAVITGIDGSSMSVDYMPIIDGTIHPNCVCGIQPEIGENQA